MHNDDFQADAQGTDRVERLQSASTEAQATLVPPETTARHVETYRGVSFEISGTGYAMFTSPLPDSAIRWASWDRFLPDDASSTLLKGSTEDVCLLMRAAIYRAHCDNPVYRGDILDRYTACRGQRADLVAKGSENPEL